MLMTMTTTADSVNAKDFNCKQDTDYMKSKPLIVTIDWGNIMTMTVSQDQGERYRNLKLFTYPLQRL
jgi:hypothetical protein